jgi:hypothetical protein
MESADLQETEMRARRAYELTRVRRAGLAFAPVVLLVAVAALIGERVGYVLAFGSALFMLGAGLLWYGRGVKRAVLPGLAAGLVPLVFGLCAKHVGHACMGAGCMTFCVPACFVGGVIAGLVIDFVTLRSASKVGFWVAASGIGLLTGAMGCACAGALGLAGLFVGFAISAVPGMVAAVLRRRTAG